MGVAFSKRESHMYGLTKVLIDSKGIAIIYVKFSTWVVCSALFSGHIVHKQLSYTARNHSFNRNGNFC